MAKVRPSHAMPPASFCLASVAHPRRHLVTPKSKLLNVRITQLVELLATTHRLAQAMWPVATLSLGLYRRFRKDRTVYMMISYVFLSSFCLGRFRFRS